MSFYNIDFTNVNSIIGLVVLVGLPAFLYLLLRKFVKQPLYYIFMCCFSVLAIIFYILLIEPGLYVALGGLIVLTLIATFINIGAFRPYLLNSSPNPLTAKKPKKAKSELLYDRDDVISKVNEAVQICVKINKNKTYDRVSGKNEAGIGLLICFERNDKLDSIIDSGYEVINADVSPRLLTSIFFEGTQLHDGAVIIRDGKIYAASAFLPPTTDPVIGKFGARHRAAKGVTQKSDCVSLLVSEETGEITIFDDGDGIVVEPEDFERKFKDIYDNPLRVGHK